MALAHGSAAKNEFDVEDFAFTPNAEEQIGFFFSTITPIKIFMITSSAQRKDPWAT